MRSSRIINIRYGSKEPVPVTLGRIFSQIRPIRNPFSFSFPFSFSLKK